MSFEENVYGFIKTVSQFNYTMEGMERIWTVLFSDKQNKWHSLRVSQYDDTYFVGLVDKDIEGIKVSLGKTVEFLKSFGRQSFNQNPQTTWEKLILEAQNWLKVVKKDWIKANKYVQENYPLSQRMGVIPHSLIRHSLKGFYRLDQDVGKRNTRRFIKLVEEGYFHRSKNIPLKSLTANDFFEYCKVAYLAGQKEDEDIDKTLSGKDMYKRYADGRDEGLMEIDHQSTQEFADWVDRKHPKRTTGGHPWEIKRGGNTTHIDLSVTRPFIHQKEGFVVTLGGGSIGRLKESICMFLGIHNKGMLITISDPEGIRKRLLAQDNIGIVPSYQSLHRANQHFYEEQDVFDVMYFDDFGRYKKRLKPFIVWEGLPILTLRDYF